jgi:hypothetical protein
MRIGSDFDKIEWDIWGFNLLEPNAAIGDLIIFCFAFFLYLRIKDKSPFYVLWAKFYLFFGFSFLLGGFGHLFYNYSGLFGKSFSWLFGIIATFFVEQSMLSLWIHPFQKNLLLRLSIFKAGLFILAEIMLLYNLPSAQDASIGLLIPTINSVIGLGFALGYLGVYYEKQIHEGFRFFWIGSLILLPNVAIQGLKINIHPWFDRNDLSHVLLLSSILIYYRGLKKIEDHFTLELRPITSQL